MKSLIPLVTNNKQPNANIEIKKYSPTEVTKESTIAFGN